MDVCRVFRDPPGISLTVLSLDNNRRSWWGAQWQQMLPWLPHSQGAKRPDTGFLSELRDIDALSPD